jgi:hypothetical protein
MAGQPSLAQLLAAQLARYPTLDPKAVLAVAAQEGLGGGIGDQGTSFGPFQLHYGGAYPSSAPQGAQASQQWAWSPAGLQYALSRIASVAGGLHGAQAVANIVSRFERPANPGREIAGALAAYGLPAGSATQYQTQSGGGGTTPGAAPVPAVRQFAPGTLAAAQAAHQAVGLGPVGPALAALLSR